MDYLGLKVKIFRRFGFAQRPEDFNFSTIHQFNRMYGYNSRSFGAQAALAQTYWYKPMLQRQFYFVGRKITFRANDHDYVLRWNIRLLQQFTRRIANPGDAFLPSKVFLLLYKRFERGQRV